MEKLYKRIAGKLHYREAWVAEKAIIEHWGVVGHRGEFAEHPKPKDISEEDSISSILERARNDGYAPFDEDEYRILLTEHSVEGMGNTTDLAKRHRLEDRMNETLGWTGLGHCDGGSIGSGTMEVSCFVVDFEVAKAVISSDLKDTEFANYTRIFDEDVEN